MELGWGTKNTWKGTTVSKNYQTGKIDASRPAVPERVNVALGEIVQGMREGLLALAVGAGLQVMAAVREADMTAAV